MKKNFWRLYPKSKRLTQTISRPKISIKEKKRLQKFGKDYFDGNRDQGYGGYNYNPKFFRNIVREMIKFYKLNNESKILDIGCAKGFMLYEFKKLLPKCEISGLDISKYCLKNAKPEVKKYLRYGTCSKLPYNDKYFDLVISISTIHNLNYFGVKKSLREIIRVSKKNSFIKVNGYKTPKQKKLLDNWNIVAKTILHQSKWLKLFKEVGYKGDYDWFNV
jgi:ubiquinone/menaquinone biosynthesis C-methylase UbiE